MWAAPSEFVSSSIPSWQTLTAHAQPFRGARDLAFCLKVPLHSLLVWASSEGSGETAWMRRLAWTFAARIGDKYQIRLARPMLLITQATTEGSGEPAQMRIRAVSPKPSLFAHLKYGSRHRVRPKIGHLAPLDVCACAFEECVYGRRKVP